MYEVSIAHSSSRANYLVILFSKIKISIANVDVMCFNVFIQEGVKPKCRINISLLETDCARSERKWAFAGGVCGETGHLKAGVEPL